MSFMKRRKQTRFELADLQENTSYLHNPSCGWYRIYPFEIGQKQDFEELYWCLCEEEGLALVLVDIGEFRDDALTEDALGNLAQILQFFAKHGKEIILRVTYDRKGRGMECEPDFVKTVIGHMQQLGAVIKGYRENILLVQGILVGNWGEMHGSKFLSQERLRQLMNTWQQALGSIPIAVRTPQQWRMLHPVGAAPGEDNIGLFNDGMFGSADDLGTYGWQGKEEAGWRGKWRRGQELEFTGRIGNVVPYGGEALGISDGRQGQAPSKGPWAVTHREMVEEMRRAGVSYLNSTHDAQRLEQWKQERWEEAGIWNGKSVYDYVGCHLGYRFVVRNVELMGKRELSLKITVENTGFSTMKEPAELALHMGEERILPDVLCGLLPQESREITIKLIDSPCVVSLALRRKRDKRPILFANGLLADGSVKLGEFKA